MNLQTLLHLSLKSDEIVEILEHYELPVVYDFDRLRENTADCYWASAHGPGFEFRFDERQVLDTVFLYVRPRGKFSSVDPRIAGVPFYRTFDEAKRVFLESSVVCREGSEQGWIKGMFQGHSVHYEFDSDGALGLVTLAALPNV